MTEVNQRNYSAATSEFFNEIRHQRTFVSSGSRRADEGAQ
jgi:hypothetical protein